MYDESSSQKYAIRFRRLYLETASSGEFDLKTTWKLANYLNMALLRSRETLANVVIISALFLFAMPMGSDQLALLPRLLYFPVSILTTFAGVSFILLLLLFCEVKGWINRTVRFTGATVFSILYAALCLSFFRTVFDAPMDIPFLEIAMRISPMVLVTFASIFTISPYTSRRLLRRRKQNNLTQLIDKSKRGQLIMVSVQENYVAVTTTAGTDLLRMSLAGAMKLIEQGIGLQIHRSHWVAISAIKSIDEQTRTLELINGQKVPISAQKLPELTLELSRKDIFSQQSNLFAREFANAGIFGVLVRLNADARAILDKTFLEIFQGKKLNERRRLKIA